MLHLCLLFYFYIPNSACSWLFLNEWILNHEQPWSKDIRKNSSKPRPQCSMISCYQYRKFHCGVKMVHKSSWNGGNYTFVLCFYNVYIYMFNFFKILEMLISKPYLHKLWKIWLHQYHNFLKQLPKNAFFDFIWSFITVLITSEWIWDVSIWWGYFDWSIMTCN